MTSIQADRAMEILAKLLAAEKGISNPTIKVGKESENNGKDDTRTLCAS